MAKEVSYFDNDVTFEQGPFVYTNPLGNGYRIEVQNPGSGCPILPHGSIYQYLRDYCHLTGKTDNKVLIEQLCDRLNYMVQTAQIGLWEGQWILNPPK